MAGRNFLFVPGPTPVPERLQRAMVISMEDHRSSRFPELTHAVIDGLKRLFRTATGTPVVFASTGTGGLEAALTNLLSPGDRVLASRYGQFSQLWSHMAARLGFAPLVVDGEWGRGVPVDQYADLLERDKERRIKAVLVTHNETSTGVTSDIAAVRRALDAAEHPALLLVDSVSGLGSIDFRMDEWGVDACVAGSQKGLMLPPGLGIVCLSRKALLAHASSTQPRCFFDVGDMIRANETGYFPYTPALPLLHGLRESLAMLFEEGLENVFARHARLAAGVRAAVRDGWGLELCAREPRLRSDTVSAIVAPPAIPSGEVIDIAYRRYDLSLGAGLGQLAGKVFRVSHLGDVNELMVLGALAGVEMALLDAGATLEPGSGVAAAQACFRQRPATSRQAAT